MAVGVPVLGFLTSLFGDQYTWVGALFALGIVVVLIVLALWALKLLSGATAMAGRGRNRRIAVLDTAPIDQKRQLVLIRRDNVEHLLLIGGPQDLIVESAIPAATKPAPGHRSGKPEETTDPLALRLSTRRTKPARRPLKEPELPVAPALAPAPAPVPATPAPVDTTQSAPESGSGALDRLRELGRPANLRRSTSLRYTGLLRPVSVQDHASHTLEDDKPVAQSADSDRSEQAIVPAINQEADKGDLQDDQQDEGSKAN